MSLPADPQAELQKAIAGGRAIIVAGTGVSIAASEGHPQASWTGLLESGLSRLTDPELKDAVAAHRTLLGSHPDTIQFIATAHAITREMTARKFQAWLKDTIGSIKSKDCSLLDALEAIRLRGNLLATTNYDGLLLEGRPHLSAVTWKDNAAFLTAHRKNQTEKVLFLHGFWDAPDSVVLDERSYREITRNDSYRDELAAIWRTSTWVYVGCGENGLSDPDIGLLLECYGERAREVDHWDFCLVRRGERERLQRYFNDKGYNICAVSFGENHADLAPFLRSLLPPIVPPPPPEPVPLPDEGGTTVASTPKPPAFHAVPDYIGSHKFIGRAEQLQILTEWAKPSDPTNLLLFEAIGGNGKSMLTWEWARDEKGQYATTARPSDQPWAGRFWYSFYYRGAIMADFCRHALAYMTQRPLADFEKLKTPEMTRMLIPLLHERPWLLILDGLERVLVNYHRIDAAELPDEEANKPTDKLLGHRHPCDAIRDEDTDLLRALAAATPSKILVSSRLVPRAFMSGSDIPIPGVRPIVLPGLNDADAEAMLRACGRREPTDPGITGNSAAIRYYLKTNCDNHPLVIGFLGGLINNYLEDRGNFDKWAADPAAGGGLDLGKLGLVQRRNHILEAAINDLAPASRALLSTLALISDAVDYATLKAFNPHLPPEPEKVEKPEPPEEDDLHWYKDEFVGWDQLPKREKTRLKRQYSETLQRWQEYEIAMQTRSLSVEFRDAQEKLPGTVKDLEQRGLLQWDGRGKQYDLHPVIRGVASGAMTAADRERHGQRVVDHFTAQPHRPYEEAETLEDVSSGLHVVRTLLKLGRYQQAADAYTGDLADALLFNLAAYVDTLSLLKPFFPNGWGQIPQEVEAWDGAWLANSAAIALDECGEADSALSAFGAALHVDLEAENWGGIWIRLGNISSCLDNQGRFVGTLRSLTLALEIAELSEDEEGIFKCRLDHFIEQSTLGQWAEAAATWSLLAPMGRDWSRGAYRPGTAEVYYALFLFFQGLLQEKHLAEAERIAATGKDRGNIRNLHQLRGDWRLEQGEWALAAASYQEAVRLARESGLTDENAEIGLALAKYHLGTLTDPHDEAERLALLRAPEHLTLARLWLALGDTAQAQEHALAAYRWAWADGEPYVRRYELNKATELLQQMQVPVPVLPPYDEARDEPLPFEAEVNAAIEKLRARKAAESP